MGGGKNISTPNAGSDLCGASINSNWNTDGSSFDLKAAGYKRGQRHDQKKTVIEGG